MLGREQPFDHCEGEGAELHMFNRNRALGLGSDGHGGEEDEVGEEGRGPVTKGSTGQGEEPGVYCCARRSP